MLAMYEPVVDNPSAHTQQGEQRSSLYMLQLNPEVHPDSSSSSPQAVRHFTVYRSLYTTFYVHVAQINLPEAIAAELYQTSLSLDLSLTAARVLAIRGMVNGRRKKQVAKRLKSGI